MTSTDEVVIAPDPLPYLAAARDARRHQLVIAGKMTRGGRWRVTVERECVDCLAWLPASRAHFKNVQDRPFGIGAVCKDCEATRERERTARLKRRA